MSLIGIYGGTFDPIHNGHLHVATNLLSLLPFNQIKFIPCKLPLLKQAAHATAPQRIAMLQLALAPYEKCQLDLREITRDTPSYMIETLASLRAESPDDSLVLILGSDAFRILPEWHQWHHLLDYAHLLVINRTTKNLPLELTALITRAGTNQAEKICAQTHGLIYFQALPLYDISSTQIRAMIKQSQNIIPHVPAVIAEYIARHKLYN